MYRKNVQLLVSLARMIEVYRWACLETAETTALLEHSLPSWTKFPSLSNFCRELVSKMGVIVTMSGRDDDLSKSEYLI